VILRGRGPQVNARAFNSLLSARPRSSAARAITPRAPGPDFRRRASEDDNSTS